MLLSIVFGYRNKSESVVRRCLESLRGQSFQDFEVLFVDYGSDTQYAQSIKGLCAEYSFCKYIYSETRGLPWSRSRALNVGIREAKGEYVFTNDVDMLFPSRVLEGIEKCLSKKCFYHIKSNCLPRDFVNFDDVDSVPLGHYDGSGKGIMIIPRESLQAIGAYDEYYYYWGKEDMDLHARLCSYGLNFVEMDSLLFLHHQWHPTNHIFKPSYLASDHHAKMTMYYYDNLKKVERNGSGWGQRLSRENRQIFKLLDVDKMEIRNRENLRLFDSFPEKVFVENKIIEWVYESPSGALIGVPHSRYPLRGSRWSSSFYRLNAILWEKLNIKFGVQEAGNQLHRSLNGAFCHGHPMIEDIYIDFPVLDGTTFLLKK